MERKRNSESGGPELLYDKMERLIKSETVKPPTDKKYVCSSYKSNTESCTAHFIREETLKQFVLQRIFHVTALFFNNATAFLDAMRELEQDEDKQTVERQRKSKTA